MQTTTEDCGLIRRLEKPEPQPGHDVIVFDPVGGDGRKYRTTLGPDGRYRPSLSERLLHRDRKPIAYAVSRNRHLHAFSRSMPTVSEIALPVRTTLEVSVDDPRWVAENLNGDPLRRLEDEVAIRCAKVIRRLALEDLDGQRVDLDSLVLEHLEEDAQHRETTCRQLLVDFAPTVGLALHRISLEWSLADDFLERTKQMIRQRHRAEIERDREKLDHGVRTLKEEHARDEAFRRRVREDFEHTAQLARKVRDALTQKVIDTIGSQPSGSLTNAVRDLGTLDRELNRLAQPKLGAHPENYSRPAALAGDALPRVLGDLLDLAGDERYEATVRRRLLAEGLRAIADAVEGDGDHTSASEGQSPNLLHRLPHMDFEPLPPFAAGQCFGVEVYADEEGMRPWESGLPVKLLGPAEQRRFEFQVWLVGSDDHFVIDQPARSLVIERDNVRSSIAHFQVRVREDIRNGQGAFLSALLFFKGRPCGRVTRTVPLGISGTEGGGEALLDVDDFRDSLEVNSGTAADLLVNIIATSADGRHYTCRVATPLISWYSAGRESRWELPDRADKWVRAVMNAFTRASGFARRAALVGAGKELFDAAPAIFREVLWSLLDDPATCGRFHSILIISDEPSVPWELMVPTRFRPGETPEERSPLGVEFVLSRWTGKDNVQPPQQLPLTNSYVVAPTDPRLAKAADEAAMVIKRVPGDLIEPASVAMLDEVLRRDKRSLIHFICHGKSEEGQQILVFQGWEVIQPYFLRGMGNLERALREKRPLIFLNACGTGRLERGLVGAGGFAETFMKLGAGGVVAALWDIEDHVAHQVAEEFYRRVQESSITPFAAILRDLRRRAYESGTDEDTWAAYCFYGDPLATASDSERQH